MLAAMKLSISRVEGMLSMTHGVRGFSGGCNMLPQSVLNDLMENVCPNVVQRTKKPFTIAVEGNIGSGKTTFLKHFDHLRNATTIAEPVHKWTSVAGKYNLLKLMYEAPTKNSFNLQTYAQLTMLQVHKQQVPTEFKLIERSLYSGRYCFVENLQRSNLISAAEAAILHEYFLYLTEDEDCHVDLFVYLRTDPQLAMERVRKRDRSGESAVTMDYLKALHDLHEHWLNGKHETKQQNVIIIDANKDETQVLNEFFAYVDDHNSDQRLKKIPN